MSDMLEWRSAKGGGKSAVARPRLPDKVLVAALTTPRPAAVAVVLADGGRVLDAVKPCFEPSGSELRMVDGGLFYGHWLDSPGGEPVDDVLLVTIPPAASQTGCPQVEIHLHGSPSLVANVLETLETRGAAVVSPQVIPARAHLAGNLSLIELEAELSLPQFRSERAVRIVLGHRRLKTWIERFAMRALTAGRMEQTGWREQTLGNLEELRRRSMAARAFFRDWRIVFAGPPNSGKSTLFNLVVGEEASAVETSPGLSRDAVSRDIRAGMFSATAWDTAPTVMKPDEKSSETEKQVWARLVEVVYAADLVLWVVDASRAPDVEELSAAVELLEAARIKAPAEMKPPLVAVVYNRIEKQIGEADGVGDWEGLLEAPEGLNCKTGLNPGADARDRLEALIETGIQRRAGLGGNDMADTGEESANNEKESSRPEPVLFMRRQLESLEEFRRSLAAGCEPARVLAHIRDLLGSTPNPESLRKVLLEAGVSPPEELFSGSWTAGPELTRDEKAAMRRRREKNT